MNQKLKYFLASLAIVVCIFIVVLYLAKEPKSEVTALGGVNNSFVMTLPTNASSTVLTSSTVVLATSTGRLYALVTNDSSNVVYLSIGTPALTGKGIRLAAGGSFEINGDNAFQGPIYGISSATSNVSYLEK